MGISSMYLQLRSSTDPVILEIYNHTPIRPDKTYKTPWDPRKYIMDAVTKLRKEKDWKYVSENTQKTRLKRILKLRFQAEAREESETKAPMANDRLKEYLGCESLMLERFQNVYDKLKGCADKQFYTSVFMDYTICSARKHKLGYTRDGNCSCVKIVRHLATSSTSANTALERCLDKRSTAIFTATIAFYRN